MKRTIISLVIMAFITATTQLHAQRISASAQLGWGIPQGSVFKAENDEKVASGGITYDIDALYLLEQFDYKLGFGLNYNGSVIFGVKSNENGISDGGLYGLNFYGVKGYYKFFDNSVSPYASLGLGLTQFSTPEVRSGDDIILESKSAFSVGIKPEIGVSLGGFLISASYLVPFKYKFKYADGSDFNESAGVLQISIGYRFENLFEF